MRRLKVVSVGLLGMGLWAGEATVSSPARAASFDCAKAKSAIEVLICTTPALNSLDDALKLALDGAVKRAGDGRAALLADHRRWLAETPGACGLIRPPAGDPVIACLTQAYQKQIAALTAAAPAPASAAPPAALAQTPPQPGPAVTLEAAQLPAAGRQTTYLSLDAPAWVTVQTESATGVALKLVDMIAGPLGAAGDAGQRDGRIDALLDRGRYKLILTGAEKTDGSVTVTARSATELQAPAVPLAQAAGDSLTTSLGDGQQRSYWITVGTEPLAILATGRALADLRLWRDGTELAPLTPDIRLADSAPGKPQRVLSLTGNLPPGRYKLTLYGGAPVRWTDGSAEMPAALRLAPQRLTTLDFRAGTIGPMGIEQAIVPAEVDFARIELPAVAPVRLSARGLSTGQGTGFAEITRLTRRPVADMSFAPDPGGTLITVEGAPGQAFTLANLTRVSAETRLPTAKAAHLITLLDAAPGSGGFPLTAFSSEYDKLLASTAQRLSLRDGLRSSLTLDGRETLYVQITEAGRYRLKTQGVPHFWSLYPANSYEAAPNSPSGAFDLEAGLYRLSLRPSTAKTGPVDVSFSGEEATGTPTAPVSARLLSMLVPEPPTGTYNYPLVTTAERASAPAGMAIYPLPLKLAATAPVLLGLAPEQSFDLPLAPVAAGTLSVSDDSGKPMPFQLDGKPATGKAALAAGAHKLTVKNTNSAPLGLRLVLETRASAPQPPNGGETPAPPAYPRLTAGQAYALDLSGTDPRRFDLLVEEAGLYRIETQGRLAVQARLRTLLLPYLARAAENGPGHNAVLEQYLRAGRYQVDLTALRKTQGRVGLSLSRAALAEGERLVPNSPARVALARGTGAILPFTIPKRGTYDLHVLSLADPIAFRLEDADGWPLLPLGHATESLGAAGRLLTVTLDAGDYRLVLLPPALPARAVVRLTPQTESPPAPQGHGPHPLALNGSQDFRWLEPAQPDEPRTPDQWDFTLPGPTRLTLALTDGMTGDVQREEGGSFKSVGQISAALPFDATVAGGRYRLSVTALARNNRLGYRLTSTTAELLPDQPRRVLLPTRQSFSLETPQTVRLASYGTQDVRATLRDADGQIVAEADDRLNDWNFVLVRALPAGRYTLTAEAVKSPPAGADPAAMPEGESSAEQEPSYSEEGEAEASPETPEAAPALDPRPSPLAQLAAGAVELSLTHLPETAVPPLALAPGESQTVPVTGTQILLPLKTGTGAVRIDAAPGPELLLSLERQRAPEGPWDTLGQASSAAPQLALLPEAGGVYRLRIVPLSGSEAAGRTVALRALDLPAQTMTDGPRFTPLDGLPLAAARLTVPGGTALDLGSVPTGLTALSGGDGLAQAVAAPVLLPAGEDLWLFRPTTDSAPLTVKPLAPARDEPLVLRPSGPVTLATGAVPDGKLVLWQADAPQGQPLLALGGAAGLFPGASLATGPDARVRLTALGAAPMPLITLTRHVLDKPLQMDGKAAAVSPSIPPRGSLDLLLPSGSKRLTLDLPAGVTAEAEGLPLLGRTGVPAAYQLETKADRLRLYNLTAAPAQAAVRQLPAPDPRLTVTAKQSFKRFLPAAGTLVLTVEAAPGQSLRIEGATAVWQGANGQVLRGSRLAVAGPGVLTLDHTAGLVAVWLDGPGANLWPDSPPQAVSLPKSLPLSGPAQALKLALTEASLLHIRSTAPVIAGLRSGEGAETVRLFPTGADWYRYLPPGPVDLHLAAAQDGGLSGSLDLTVSPVTPVQDGLSAPVPLAAGESRAFAFTVPRAGKIGVGVKALRDPAAVRLLDAKGSVIGDGLVQYRTLAPGAYVLEVAAPADTALTVQAAVVGIALPDRGPPPDVRQAYLELVGLRPNAP